MAYSLTPSAESTFTVALVALAVIAVFFITTTRRTDLITDTDITNSELSLKLKTTTSSSPNFVYILADDLGAGSLGYSDHDISFASPHLTKLAQSGIIFSNYYAQEVQNTSLISPGYVCHNFSFWQG